MLTLCTQTPLNRHCCYTNPAAAATNLLVCNAAATQSTNLNSPAHPPADGAPSYACRPLLLPLLLQ